MVIAIGLLPNSYFIYSTLCLIGDLVVRLATSSRVWVDDIFILAICLAHVVVYAFFYRWLSKWIASRISKIHSERIRITLMLAIVVGVVVTSFLFPVYFLMGDGEGATNIVGVFDTV